uniref:Uncharacterized protein n=1 Tax=Pseudomonas fluorescens (strain SBW25) TaxID=216595 RepID=A0A0G4E523_PSEFS|nr:hypothetical protein PQBR57_0150 [Pseudomonas fluorescens SBW25]
MAGSIRIDRPGSSIYQGELLGKLTHQFLFLVGPERRKGYRYAKQLL